MTDAELTLVKANALKLLDGGDAFFFDELFTAALEGKEKFASTDTQTGNYDQTWLSERVFDNRTSLVIDPPDGRIPPLAPGFAERARARAEAARGRGPADRAQDLNLTTWCVHFCTPNLTPVHQSYFAFTQSADTVVMRMEMIHDSRDRWEGDTLVVDTTNFSPKVNFRGSADGLHLIEKFRRVSTTCWSTTSPSTIPPCGRVHGRSWSR
jgi:hypothetical protein